MEFLEGRITDPGSLKTPPVPSQAPPSPLPLHQIAMLLWTTLICLFSVDLVVSEFASPEVLADNPNTSLQPLEDTVEGWGSSDDLHLIRGLLEARNASPFKNDFQKRDFLGLRLIPGLLVSRKAAPFEGGLQDRDSSDLHLIRGLLSTRDAQPEILAGYNLGVALQQPKASSQNKDSSRDLHVIRGLLVTRQQCPTGYGQCSNAPGKSVFLHYLILSFSLPCSALRLLPPSERVPVMVIRGLDHEPSARLERGRCTPS